MVVNRRLAAFWYCNALMALYGVSMIMLGTLLPEIIASFDLSLSRGGLIVTLQGVGGLASLAAGSVAADRVRKPAAILVSFAALGAVLAATGAAGSYGLLLVVFFLSGAAVRILDTMLNAYVGDILPERRGAAMNILHMCFGIGAFAGPMLARGLLDAGLSWRLIYAAVGIAYCVAALPGLVTIGRTAAARGNRGAPETLPRQSGRSLFANRHLIVLGAVLFFYVLHQSGVSAWLPLSVERSLSGGAVLSSFSLSLFWAGIIASRLAASRIADRTGPMRLVVVGSFIGGAALTAGLLVASPVVVLAAVFAAGFSTGAIIPLTISAAYVVFPANTGSSTSILSVYMLAGRLVGPWLVGAVADASSLTAGMVLTGLALIACGAAGLGITAARRLQPETSR